MLSRAGLLLCCCAFPLLAQADPPVLQDERPAQLVRPTAGFDYDRREVMIPMRDGVKLHTVILVPHGAQHAPMLLTRTPYNASELTSYGNSAKLIGALDGTARRATT
jgi:predicted acyl esterase